MVGGGLVEGERWIAGWAKRAAGVSRLKLGKQRGGEKLTGHGGKELVGI